jgi:[ribosomal protein S5]-alanine N-acetyltransferase
MIIFQNGDLVLRHPTLPDAPKIAFYGNNRKIWLNCTNNFPHPYTLADAEKWITERTANPPIHDAVIEWKGEAIGWMGLAMGTNIWTNKGEMGYWIGEPFWGLGIMSQLIQPFTTYCFSVLPQLHKIQLFAYTRNKASIRLFEKAGYVFESFLIQNCIKDNVIEDEVGYYVLRSDWEYQPEKE